MAEPFSVSRFGNQMRILMDDDSVRYAVPAGAGGWIISPPAEPVEPPTEFPAGGTFDFPFPLSLFNPDNGYKSASRPTHEGMDFGAASGADDCAAGPGRVAEHNPNHPGWGNMVRLEHNIPGLGIVSTLYAHHQTGSVVVSVGQTVTKGQKLGLIGNTGRSFGAHCHFETWLGTSYGTHTNPLYAIPDWNRRLGA